MTKPLALDKLDEYILARDTNNNELMDTLNAWFEKYGYFVEGYSVFERDASGEIFQVT